MGKNYNDFTSRSVEMAVKTDRQTFFDKSLLAKYIIADEILKSFMFSEKNWYLCKTLFINRN